MAAVYLEHASSRDWALKAVLASYLSFSALSKSVLSPAGRALCDGGTYGLAY